MSQTEPVNPSPRWGSNMKLIVGLLFAALFLLLLFYFRHIIGPLLLAFVLTYLLYPLIERISHFTHLSWRWTVNLLYLLLIILLLGSGTLTGLAIVQQVQNLISVVDKFVSDLPTLVADISTHQYFIGPFLLDMSKFDLPTVTDRVLSYVQPLIGRLGFIVSTFATGAVSILTWGTFILLISYFVLVDRGQRSGELVHIEIPGYTADIKRLGNELRRTWNAFLRGQIIMFGLVFVTYSILMTALGVRYSVGIALMAGLARFIPYVGGWATWTTLILVSFFQGSNYFGLLPWQFTVLALVVAILTDQVFDNLVSPRILGQTMGVHPAAVLVAAIVAANLIGFIGLVLAAPVLATLIIVGRYAVRKMLDLDPWEGIEREYRVKPRVPIQILNRLRTWFRSLIQRRT
jgi:predicted PurR-regulated permease PerM